MHLIALLFFSIAAGFTASAIVANLYRISGFQAETPRGELVRLAVLVIAGPSVLLESALRGFNAKDWRAASFWLVTAGVLYWSLALGLLVIDVAIHI
jgi:hypothetical protein